MPLPAPRTWADGENPENIPTADALNLDWRDSWEFFLTQRPMILLHHTTGAVSVNTAGVVAIPFDTEVLKRGGMVHSNVTNNTRITVPYTGQYAGYMFLGVGTATTLTSKFSVRLRKNGSTTIARASDMGPTVLAATEVHGTFTADLVANDYVEFTAISTGSNATTSVSALNRCKFAMWYVGDYA